MTLVLEMPAELEAKIRRAAAAAGRDVSVYVLEAAREKAAAEVGEFDRDKFKALAATSATTALEYALARISNPRYEVDLGPLPDDAVHAAYEEQDEHVGEDQQLLANGKDLL